MNKIRNHSIGAALTAVTLTAVVLTGCSQPTEECEDVQSLAPMAMVDGLEGKVGGGSGGSRGGSRGGGGKVNTNKPGSVKQKPGKAGKTGGTGGGSGHGKTKAHDWDDCEDEG